MIGIENSGGGCGWVKMIADPLTRINIEDLVDISSEYGKNMNDFLHGEPPFPVFSEFLQIISRRLNVEVQPDLNLEQFSDKDVEDIFCHFFKEHDGLIRVFIFVGKGDGVDISSEGSVEKIDRKIREIRNVRKSIRMTR
jgi:hypothetical protein